MGRQTTCIFKYWISVIDHGPKENSCFIGHALGDPALQYPYCCLRYSLYYVYYSSHIYMNCFSMLCSPFLKCIRENIVIRCYVYFQIIEYLFHNSQT